jgi:hypothetical protein
VLNRRRQIAGLLSSGSRLRTQTGRVLSGLVLAVTTPHIADAALEGERRADNQDRKHDDPSNGRDTSEKNNQSEKESDERNDGKASAETRDSSAKSDNSDKRVRKESTNENDESREQRATDSEKSRGDSGRNGRSDSDSSESSAEGGDSHHPGDRRVLSFEQRANEPTGDSPSRNAPDATSATPANPNVVIDDVPDTSINDLVVQANDNVLASVSTSGGFAFARSGDVIAVSGPDGASIVQTGDVSTGTNGTSPTAPSDEGGNNNVDFMS